MQLSPSSRGTPGPLSAVSQEGQGRGGSLFGKAFERGSVGGQSVQARLAEVRELYGRLAINQEELTRLTAEANALSDVNSGLRAECTCGAVLSVSDVEYLVFSPASCLM
jgi:uncharacterized small protein (DUF1192 family)